jgi:molecular chaperone HscB
MTNYFKWFSLEKAYNINHTLLRKAFLAKSMELHPDKSNIDEAEAITLSEYNNKAYAILKGDYTRLEYILQLEGIIIPDEKYQLPQDFLMEMLEINMDIENAKENNDEKAINDYKLQIEAKKIKEFESAKVILNQYDTHTIDTDDYKKLKNFYFISKYLLRIEESINTFASH